MQVVRAITLPILALILFVLISSGLVVAALANTITNKAEVRLLLGKEGIYEDLSQVFISGSIDEFGSSEEVVLEEEASQASVDNQAINEIINRYFTKDFYNMAITTGLDSTYAWLEGETDNPNFSIPVASNQQEFQTFVTDAFVNRFNSLPPCPAGTVVDENFNPLEASCQPVGYDAANVQTFIADASTEPEFQQLYTNANISSEQFFSPADIATNELPNNYQNLKMLGWLIPLLIVVTAGLMWLVQFKRSKGIKTAAITALVPASLVLLGAIVVAVFFDNFLNLLLDQAPSQNDAVARLTNNLIGGFVSLVNTKVLLYSSLIVFVCIALLVANMFLNKRENAAAAPAPPPLAKTS